ncbi:50S ribosomal protein L6 [Patescibacteria group bacterium]|nr:50S ribosomal protein L6 [Patescibacteria group bacterium]MBU1075337.1 50S ribosomal protein L6 [Patescibacteria group bacterium]MBU1951411.1 50S ribosomal protein L6 [Patescibacteria group bacterium]MBU2235643.1 50S ribosomal protein L6 [Patescibacteria group bacterium]
MSRIGKQPINLPDGVTFSIENNEVTIKGPKGELTQEVDSRVKVEQKENEIVATVKNPENKTDKAYWGLFRMLIANMVKGVTEGFEKQLEVNGVGFKTELKGKKLILHVGFSHPVEYNFPESIEGKVEKNVITVSGIDKQKVGQTAAEIRAIKKPEPYKGKGIKYIDEQIRRKAGKVVKSAEG